MNSKRAHEKIFNTVSHQEIQMKTTMICYFTPTTVTKTKTENKADQQGREEIGALIYITGGD